mmetsp:Transcript_75675/g.244862  ORF Transcript_75675/g.244862 Transcript_75675/m.244862 type:complete len:229 (+) Transcript_75675:823-1509(+)
MTEATAKREWHAAQAAGGMDRKSPTGPREPVSTVAASGAVTAMRSKTSGMPLLEWAISSSAMLRCNFCRSHASSLACSWLRKRAVHAAPASCRAKSTPSSRRRRSWRYWDSACARRCTSLTALSSHCRALWRSACAQSSSLARPSATRDSQAPCASASCSPRRRSASTAAWRPRSCARCRAASSCASSSSSRRADSSCSRRKSSAARLASACARTASRTCPAGLAWRK